MILFVSYRYNSLLTITSSSNDLNLIDIFCNFQSENVEKLISL